MDILSKCSRCKQNVILPINIKTGLCYKLCLECNEKNKINYQNNKEKFKEKNKEYRNDNKEKILEKKKEYYQNNKEELKEKNKCIINLCDKQKIKGKYCVACYYHINPEMVPKRIKFKEIEIYNFIKTNFPNLNIIYDQSLKGDGCCMNTRPDFMIHLNEHTIIIECDENQHSYYKDTCKEITRIPYIQETLNRPITVIRFNPDSYKINDVIIKSCFAIDKRTGLTIILKDQFNLWNNRLEVLKICIEQNININPTIDIKEHFLFFDS